MRMFRYARWLMLTLLLSLIPASIARASHHLCRIRSAGTAQSTSSRTAPSPT